MNKKWVGRTFEYINLFLATAFVFLPILYRVVLFPYDTVDYPLHINWAKNIIDNQQNIPINVITHAGWQWLVALSNKFLGTSWGVSSILVTFSSIYLAVCVMFFIFRKNVSALLAGSLSIALVIIAPLFFIEPLAKNPYLIDGYIATNVYHNPTILLLKPFAILIFIFAGDLVYKEKPKWFWFVATALLSIVSIFSKPNYVICFLPALFIILGIGLLKKQRINWSFVLFGFVIPSLLMLLWQYLVTFKQDTESSIIFAPLLVMNQYSKLLLPKLFLSITYPIIITLCFWNRVIKDKYMQLGWLGFVFGSSYVYLFAETGERYIASNFYWSAEISLFILFFSCTWFLVKNPGVILNPFKKWLILTSGFLHIVFGIIYYFSIIT